MAETALDAAVHKWTQVGLTEKLGVLVREVWGVNLARYEPEELADNAKTLAITCSENLAGRIERRIRGHEFEPELWEVDGLRVAKPNGSLRLDHSGRHVYVMKAPMVYGRRPQWDSMAPWAALSDVRETAARGNTFALAGYRTPALGQDELFPFLIDGTPESLANFMLVWAGDMAAPVTAGWLTVPVLGERPFVAVRRLWFDAEEDVSHNIEGRGPAGPSYDKKPAVTPALSLKPRPGRTGEA